MISFAMQVLTFRAFRKYTIYFRTVEEREKIILRLVSSSLITVDLIEARAQNTAQKTELDGQMTT